MRRRRYGKVRCTNEAKVWAVLSRAMKRHEFDWTVQDVACRIGGSTGGVSETWAWRIYRFFKILPKEDREREWRSFEDYYMKGPRLLQGKISYYK